MPDNSGGLVRVGEMEINQDVTFQEREWIAARIGWAAMALLLTAAVAGLFGNGPLSWTTVTTSEGLEVDYERFGRRGGSQDLTMRAPAEAATSGKWEIDISRGYVAALELGAITPQPDQVESTPTSVRFTFLQSNSDAELEVIFAVTPRRLWSQEGHVRLVGGDPVSVDQFFFP